VTAARHAAEAAEAIRALNHATRPHAGGLVFPADAYDVTAELSALSARLIQALAQLAGFLNRQHAAGQVTIVAGPHEDDPDAVLAEVTAALDTATAASRRLHHALDTAHNALTWAAATGD
jgi:hypothetical protein